LLLFISIQCSSHGQEKLSVAFKKNPLYVADGFDFPVGKPEGKGQFKAQEFGVRSKSFGGNFHLGEDWNRIGPGNIDLGDPIYTIGNGFVVFAGYGGSGWGNVIRIVHCVKKNGIHKYYESVYGHLQKMSAKTGQFVLRGKNIGAMGNANGLYYAHLHLEVRDDIEMPLGGGYDAATTGFISPTKFIKKNRWLKKRKF